MSVLYVMSEATGAGKTMICASLAANLKQDGHEVFVSKVHGDVVGDINRYKNEFSLNVQLPQSDAPEDVKEFISTHQTKSAVTLVEASSEISTDEQIEFLSDLDVSVVIVATVDEVEQVISTSKTLGDKLKGVIINSVSQYLGTHVSDVVAPAYKEEGITVLGVIPEERKLLSLSVSQIADRLNGRFFSDNGDREKLVESFMVGGFGMDPGQYSFSTRNNKAVIVRGDRPDVQMSALQTDMNAFIMTRGLEPIEYVQYESAEEEVPIIIVDSDTLDTMDAVADLQTHAKFDHIDKLDHSSRLIKDHLEIVI